MAQQARFETFSDFCAPPWPRPALDVTILASPSRTMCPITVLRVEQCIILEKKIIHNE
jgi:hypothetical protein